MTSDLSNQHLHNFCQRDCAPKGSYFFLLSLVSPLQTGAGLCGVGESIMGNFGRNKQRGFSVHLVINTQRCGHVLQVNSGGGLKTKQWLFDLEHVTQGLRVPGPFWPEGIRSVSQFLRCCT